MAKELVLRRRESFPDAFRRIADEQLTRAAAALTAEELSHERRVHEARKRFKESRALVRLFRVALGDAFGEQNRWYRDAGRALAAYRDATAAAAAVDALPAAMRDEIGRVAMRKLRGLVRERRDALYADTAAVDEAIRSVLATFAAERLRIEELPLNGGAGAVEKAFAATFAAGRKAMEAAFATRRDLAFHDWRKRVKDHWVHVKLFLPVWPELMSAREEALDAFSHLLGEHHDLAVLAAIVSGTDAATRVTRFLAARQKAIAREAGPIGRKLYAVRPRDHARETMALWRVWHRA
jgi:CHAD domain-containing protein